MISQTMPLSVRTLLWAAIFGTAVRGAAQQALSISIHPAQMAEIGTVSPNYVSYNVEMVEITGGRFWKPFDKEGAPSKPSGDSKPQTSADPYQYRPPINLYNPRLRKLAAALSPAFIRVSGTWRNSTYFQDDDAPALQTPPDGFKNVLTRAEWKGVIDFSHAVGAELVTSVSMSAGTRGPDGIWTPDQARKIFEYTRKLGGHVAATEFMNEPTFATIGGAPAGYNGAAFAKDVKVFQAFLRSESPDTIFLGPGSIGEGVALIDGMPMPKLVSSEAMLKATGPVFDAFSYHFYTTLSERCVGKAGLSWEKVLTPAYLDRNPAAEAYYAKLRDAYLPGKAIWLTETGEAGCGGDRWASAFVDSFRFADQLGVLAQKNVQTVMVNTLASSDYGLLDESTYEPRPNYWLAFLWKRTMGSKVLDPGAAPPTNLRLYAHCMKDQKGGVSLMALNIDGKSDVRIQIPVEGERYTFSSSDLLSKDIFLNGSKLKVTEDGTVPRLHGGKLMPGIVDLPPQTITFITLPFSQNPSCM
jgi:heparanase